MHDDTVERGALELGVPGLIATTAVIYWRGLMFRSIVVGIAALVLSCGAAEAANCPGSSPYYPYVFSANTTAVASQVNGDFNYIVGCANNQLAPLASPSFTGSVGIGTATPSTTLQVMGGDLVSGNFYEVQRVTNSPESKGLIFGYDNSSVTGIISSDQGASGISFWTHNGSAWGERMRVASSGNVGVGTATPGYNLDVAGNFHSTGYAFSANVGLNEYVLGSSGANFGFISNNTTGVWSLGYGATLTTVGTPVLTWNSSGNIGIGTTTPAQALHVVGTIRQSGCVSAALSANASGDIICTSDARLKNILGQYTGGLDALGRITPQRFRFKNTPVDPDETAVHDGFIAQDVMKAIPDAVGVQHNGYYSVDTTAILAASVNAINQLKAINDRQAAEIADLTQRESADDRRLAVAEARLEALERSNRTRQASAGPQAPAR